MKYALLVVSLLLTIVASFLLGNYLSRRKQKARKETRSQSEFPLSAFSVVDHPAAEVGQEQFTPQREAEVYLTYGKKHEATQVLNTALRNGKISAQEVELFWQAHDPEHGKD